MGGFTKVLFLKTLNRDEFLELKNNSTAKDLFEDKTVTEFSLSMCNSYHKTSEIAIWLLLPFVTTYFTAMYFSSDKNER